MEDHYAPSAPTPCVRRIRLAAVQIEPSADERRRTPTRSWLVSERASRHAHRLSLRRMERRSFRRQRLPNRPGRMPLGEGAAKGRNEAVWTLPHRGSDS